MARQKPGIVMAYIVMAYIVMAYIVMAYIVMAYIVMALHGYASVRIAPQYTADHPRIMPREIAKVAAM